MTNENELTRQETGLTTAVDLSGQELPNLNEAPIFPLSLGGEYWTPESVGEKKRVFFFEIKTARLLSFDGKELIDLECSFFLEQDKDLNTHTIYNGSRVLVGIIESCMASGLIQKGTALEIRYDGKKKNKSNGNFSDRWSVKPLIINI
jgi:hypothetical protein